MLINVGTITLDITPGSIVENLRSGLLVRGSLIASGVDPFVVPRSANNDLALHRIAFPDSQRNRPKFLNCTCDFGPYDRIYVDGYDSSGFRCRLLWSDDPIRRLSETALSDIDAGSVQFNQPYIESRQSVVQIGLNADKGDQWPDTFYGHYSERFTKESSPHLAYGMYRPWINPHWLLKKAVNQLGYAFSHPLASAPSIQSDIAYLLDDDIGPGGEDSRRLKIDTFLPVTSSTDPIRQVAFNQLFNIAQATVRTDPSNTWTGTEWYPENGWYEITVSGRVVTYQQVGLNDEEIPDLPQVRLSVRFGSYIVREIDMTAQIDEEADRDGFFTFRATANLWMSKGSKMQVHVRSRVVPEGETGLIAVQSANNQLIANQTVLPGVSIMYGWNDDAKGLTLEARCVKAWYKRGQIEQLKNLLRKDISCLRLMEGICHIYGLRVDYDTSTRTVSLLPSYPVTVDNISIPGFYANTDCFDFPYQYVSQPQVSIIPSERPDRIKLSFSGSDDNPYEWSREEFDSQLEVQTYQSANPLFVAAENITVLMPRLERVSQMNQYVAPIEVYAAHLVKAGEFNDTDGPTYEVDPIIARYYGDADYVFPAAVEGVFAPSPIIAGLALVSIPERQTTLSRQVDMFEQAYAATLPILVITPSGNAAGTPLTYGQYFDLLLRRDLLSRYEASELIASVEMTRTQAQDFDYRKRWSVLLDGRPIETIAVACEQVDGYSSNVRLVAIVDDPTISDEVSPCQSNSAQVNISVNTANRTASASFVVETGDNEIDQTVYEYRRDGGTWTTYTPGQALAFVSGQLEFRVTVSFTGVCADLVATSQIDASAYSVALCGGTPGITVNLNAADNWVEAFPAADMVEFSHLNEFEVSVDGEPYETYVAGTRIENFSEVIFRRRGQVSADCPVREFTRVVTSTDPGVTNPPCSAQPSLTASVSGPGVLFGVDATGVPGQIQFQISVLQNNATRWVDFNGVPVRVAGKVALITRYTSGCPDTFKMYSYTLAGQLTPI